MVTGAAGQEFVITTIINICFEHLLFICSYRVWGVLRVEESVELISQFYRNIYAVNVSLLLRYLVDCRGVLHTARV